MVRAVDSVSVAVRAEAVTAMRPVTIIGAATSAGTHHGGQERAPDAMRAAGLVERLVRADPESYRQSVFDQYPAVTRYPDHAVRADPAGCANGALAALREAERLIVHFDVDAVDSGDLPLANFPHYGTGVPLAVARQVLSVLFAAPALSAIVLTEVNPSYDPSGDSLDPYLEAVAGALITGLAGLQ